MSSSSCVIQETISTAPPWLLMEGIYIHRFVLELLNFNGVLSSLFSRTMGPQEQLDELHEVIDVLADLPGKLKHEIMVQSCLALLGMLSSQSSFARNRCLWASTHSFLGIYTTRMRYCYG